MQSRLREIEQSLLENTQGIVHFITWYRSTEKLPRLAPHSSYESLPVVLAIDGDYTIGYFDHIHERWHTDIGVLEIDAVRYWAHLPDPTQ